MRRPYNIPFVSIPRNVSRSPSGPSAWFDLSARSRTGEVSIPAQLLTKGDRPVAPTEPLMPPEAPSPPDHFRGRL